MCRFFPGRIRTMHTPHPARERKTSFLEVSLGSNDLILKCIQITDLRYCTEVLLYCYMYSTEVSPKFEFLNVRWRSGPTLYLFPFDSPSSNATLGWAEHFNACMHAYTHVYFPWYLTIPALLVTPCKTEPSSRKRVAKRVRTCD